ncbi:hypothetical protein [Pseudomonas sp. FEN]|uniref:hypothetical protein n=1 Tax=Pseudomonas sp. FEN TaxID=2767468 RepID=UPI00174C2E1B|nr:hypothetical protein [Pseudomonas sp. FEN]CAD5201418.1 hypothetical protein [Pseudomonas sp. FEN]
MSDNALLVSEDMATANVTEVLALKGKIALMHGGQTGDIKLISNEMTIWSFNDALHIGIHMTCGFPKVCLCELLVTVGKNFHGAGQCL